MLNAASPLRRVTAPNGRVVGLLRFDGGTALSAGEAALILINPDFYRPDGVELGPLLTAAGGRIAAFVDRTPAVPPLPFAADAPLTLDPLGVHVFIGRAGEVTGRAPSPSSTSPLAVSPPPGSCRSPSPARAGAVPERG